MGMYYETCFITNLPIVEGSEIVAFDEEMLESLTKRDLSWTDMPNFTFVYDMPPLDLRYGVMSLIRGKMDSIYGESGGKKVYIACYKKAWDHLLTIKSDRSRKEMEEEIREFADCHYEHKKELIDHFKKNKKDYFEIYHVFHVLRYTLRRCPFDSIVTKGQQDLELKTHIDFLEMCVQIPKMTSAEIEE